MKEIKALFNIIILITGIMLLISGGSCGAFTLYDEIKTSDGYYPLRIFIWFMAVEIALIGWWLLMIFSVRSKAILAKFDIHRIQHSRNIAMFLIGLNTLIFGGLCLAMSFYEVFRIKNLVGISQFLAIGSFALFLVVIGWVLIRSSLKARNIYKDSETSDTNADLENK